MPITRPELTYCHELGVRDGSSGDGTFAADESQETLMYRVPWASRYDALTYFLGYSKVTRGTDGRPTGLERLVPLKHPDNEQLVATRIVSTSGHKFAGRRQDAAALPGANSWLSTYESCDLTVQYEHVKYNVYEDGQVENEWGRFVEIMSLQPSADYIMLPGGVLRYTRASGTTVPHDTPIPFNVGKVDPVLELKVVWRGLPQAIYSFELDTPNPWFDRIWGTGEETVPYLGSVNQDVFLNYYPPGSVLFSALNILPRTFPNNLGLMYDVEFTFAIKPTRKANGTDAAAPGGWNFLYYWSLDQTGGGADANGYYFASSDGVYRAPGSVPDYKSLYAERDLNLLTNVT